MEETKGGVRRDYCVVSCFAALAHDTWIIAEWSIEHLMVRYCLTMRNLLLLLLRGVMLPLAAFGEPHTSLFLIPMPLLLRQAPETKNVERIHPRTAYLICVKVRRRPEGVEVFYPHEHDPVLFYDNAFSPC